LRCQVASGEHLAVLERALVLLVVPVAPGIVMSLLLLLGILGNGVVPQLNLVVILVCIATAT